MRSCSGKTTALYYVRWQRFSAAEDTWEPIENVAETERFDRFVQGQQARKLGDEPGAALIEYDDGETVRVDLIRVFGPNLMQMRRRNLQ